MEDGSSILGNINWPKCIVDELAKEENENDEVGNSENSMTVTIPQFSFIDPTCVRTRKFANM